ncbi:hypothetical protein CDAR_107051 [Caerostris darwini]|uniref:Secreted protein n=1 Tax=Caerostris darwini TaxID=1538125 RepID=A0AAV4SZ21_9ARAC|nr:hypothetical protein CDAR_107051 [Caerostris darwini]
MLLILLFFGRRKSPLFVLGPKFVTRCYLAFPTTTSGISLCLVNKDPEKTIANGTIRVIANGCLSVCHCLLCLGDVLVRFPVPPLSFPPGRHES